MSEGPSTSNARLRDRIREGGFAGALSGRGHRATRASLGALPAIVDRSLSDRIIQIASVSRGSITNAFVAQRCDLDKIRSGQLDASARPCLDSDPTGLLTWRWIVVLLLVACFAKPPALQFPDCGEMTRF
jgi:hypothetical protein